MTTIFSEDEELSLDRDVEDDGLLEDKEEVSELDGELSLDDVVELEEDENIGHRVQTFDPSDDGVDNYFDERYFDE